MPFSPPLLSILSFQPILFYTIVTEGHYMLFSTEEFFKKKVEQSCFTVVWQMTCQRSRICWCASCSHHIFVLLVQFALSAFARDYCRFPSRRLLYTSICLSIFFLRSMFAFIPLFVDFVRYLTLAVFTLETDNPCGQIIRLVHFPSWCEFETDNC